MKRSILHSSATVIAALITAGLVLVAPAHADPPSGSTTTVDMPMPGPAQPAGRGSSADLYTPPSVTLTAQGGGVDRDGTNGVVSPNATDGVITGPAVRAIPLIRADPTPLSPKERS